MRLDILAIAIDVLRENWHQRRRHRQQQRRVGMRQMNHGRVWIGGVDLVDRLEHGLERMVRLDRHDRECDVLRCQRMAVVKQDILGEMQGDRKAVGRFLPGLGEVRLRLPIVVIAQRTCEDLGARHCRGDARLHGTVEMARNLGRRDDHGIALRRLRAGTQRRRRGQEEPARTLQKTSSGRHDRFPLSWLMVLDWHFCDAIKTMWCPAIDRPDASRECVIENGLENAVGRQVSRPYSNKCNGSQIALAGGSGRRQRPIPRNHLQQQRRALARDPASALEAQQLWRQRIDRAGQAAPIERAKPPVGPALERFLVIGRILFHADRRETAISCLRSPETDPASCRARAPRPAHPVVWRGCARRAALNSTSVTRSRLLSRTTSHLAN